MSLAIIILFSRFSRRFDPMSRMMTEFLAGILAMITTTISSSAFLIILNSINAYALLGKILPPNSVQSTIFIIIFIAGPILFSAVFFHLFFLNFIEKKTEVLPEESLIK